MKSVFAFSLCTLMAAPVAAQSIDDVFGLTILPGWREAGNVHFAGVAVTLAPGWKTYWRQPGDAGIPPQFNFNGSDNLASVDVLWPEPKVNWDGGVRSIGYASQVVFPLRIKAHDGSHIGLTGRIQMGVCEDICIPVEISVNATLPAKGAADQAILSAIKAQIDPGTGTAVCTFQPSDDAMNVVLHLPKTSANPPEVTVEVAEPGLWIAQPKVTSLDADTWRATTEILAPSGKPTAVARSGMVITTFSSGGAFEYRGCQAG